MVRRHLKKEKLNSNLLGLFVLIFGVFVFLVVSYLAYQKISSSPSDEVILAEEDVNSFKNATAVNRADPRSQKPTKKKAYKRQNSISEKEMAGVWEARIKSGKALLEMNNGTYRLVIIQSNSGDIRYYSNGDYKIENDLVILSPNRKFAAPQDGQYSYRFLTASNMPVIVAKYKGKLIWQEPPSDVDIYVPPYHPVLDFSDDKILVWNSLD